MWVLLLLGILVASFSFDMRVEAEITSYHRKRTKAFELARAGVEWAKRVIELRRQADPSASEDCDRDPVYMGALLLQRGAGVSGTTVELGDTGRFTVRIQPEESRRNVNRLTVAEWEELLDLGGVPQEKWDELIDCFLDWTDDNDTHRINGAEKDDPFYRDKGYAPKNGPLDTVDELLLIKGFDERILYGGPADEEDQPPYRGIARWLSTWGEGTININTASREVLLTLPGLSEGDADAIIENRAGTDREWNTRDDGYDSVEQMIQLTGVGAALAERFSVRNNRYLRIVSVGESGGVRYTIWCTMIVQGANMVPVAWREEPEEQ
jgi:general secretion pathway protein K